MEEFCFYDLIIQVNVKTLRTYSVYCSHMLEGLFQDSVSYTMTKAPFSTSAYALNGLCVVYAVGF